MVSNYSDAAMFTVSFILAVVFRSKLFSACFSSSERDAVAEREAECLFSKYAAMNITVMAATVVICMASINSEK